ncbi:hypothetical protein [Streptomyces canus]
MAAQNHGTALVSDRGRRCGNAAQTARSSTGRAARPAVPVVTGRPPVPA